ncbi:hypothetical protein FJT64_002336 [Amphibalanus amphitrite]|uniref:Uncharacterized protein n=1 Tax=Amphibalanus amphitrite TaxID=1232801 RepID=A0A6A4WT74_AMPAM|nr:hypothetical protein FJT64_002336 [Amphibalanus amphitrite]
MQQWRIWRRDIVQFAEMCGWDVKTTVMNIRLQCDEKLKRVIEAEFGDRWIELTADQALTAVESILRKASNPAREKEKFHKLNQQPALEECSDMITVDQEMVRQHAQNDGTYQLLKQRIEGDTWPGSCSNEVTGPSDRRPANLDWVLPRGGGQRKLM